MYGFVRRGGNKKHLPEQEFKGGAECQIEGGIVNCLSVNRLSFAYAVTSCFASALFFRNA